MRHGLRVELPLTYRACCCAGILCYNCPVLKPNSITVVEISTKAEKELRHYITAADNQTNVQN